MDSWWVSSGIFNDIHIGDYPPVSILYKWRFMAGRNIYNCKAGRPKELDDKGIAKFEKGSTPVGHTKKPVACRIVKHPTFVKTIALSHEVKTSYGIYGNCTGVVYVGHWLHTNYGNLEQHNHYGSSQVCFVQRSAGFLIPSGWLRFTTGSDRRRDMSQTMARRSARIWRLESVATWLASMESMATWN